MCKLSANRDLRDGTVRQQVREPASLSPTKVAFGIILCVNSVGTNVGCANYQRTGIIETELHGSRCVTRPHWVPLGGLYSVVNPLYSADKERRMFNLPANWDLRVEFSRKYLGRPNANCRPVRKILISKVKEFCFWT